MLKDRLYTTAHGSHARRSAQTALWHITQAMLRWMAPFLSFTAEEAWTVLGNKASIFTETYSVFDAPDEALLAKWTRIRDIRDGVNKKIEAVRAEGKLGSSLQANVTLWATDAAHEALASLGDALKFVLITSEAKLVAFTADPRTPGHVQLERVGGNAVGDEPFGMVGTLVEPSQNLKCERCWHYRADVGHDAAHPTICGRCTSNLHGAGEVRSIA